MDNKPNRQKRIRVIPEEQSLLKEVDFYDDNILAIQDQKTGGIYAAIRWICRGIGLTDDQAKRQVKNIQQDYILKNSTIYLTTNSGSNLTRSGIREVLGIEINYIPLWLAKISITPTMLEKNPETVEKLKAYQLKAKDVLADAFLGKKQYKLPGTYLEALKELVIVLEVNQEMLPKAEAYDHFLSAQNAQPMIDVAKVLGIGRTTLFKVLRKNKILMKYPNKNKPYQEYIDTGYFKVIEKTIDTDTPFNTTVTLVTPKGIEFIRRLLLQHPELLVEDEE